jgi:hypothetical protein
MRHVEACKWLYSYSFQKEVVPIFKRGQQNRKQIGTDRLRMVLHLSEDPGQCADQFRDGREVPVVSSGLARVLPDVDLNQNRP